MMFTPENVAAASAEVERLQNELDITNADHVALWLEANMSNSSLAWLSCRIVEAHEAATPPADDGEQPLMVPRTPTDDMVQAGLYQLSVGGDEWAMVYQIWVDMFTALTMDGGCIDKLPAEPVAPADDGGLREVLTAARAELWTALGYVTNPAETDIIKRIDQALSRGER